MSVYTVHEPPPRGSEISSDAERFVFVRDGFAFWAFLLGPLWMLRHRLWLMLAGYLIISAGVYMALLFAGASRAGLAIVALLIAVLTGLEASTLRRLTLRLRGWTNVGVVSGEDLEDAERRFFDAWVQSGSEEDAPPASPAARNAPPLPRGSPPPGVIGLFPAPGGRR